MTRRSPGPRRVSWMTFRKSLTTGLHSTVTDNLDKLCDRRMRRAAYPTSAKQTCRRRRQGDAKWQVNWAVIPGGKQRSRPPLAPVDGPARTRVRWSKSRPSVGQKEMEAGPIDPNPLNFMARQLIQRRPAFGGQYSIQLSYGRVVSDEAPDKARKHSPLRRQSPWRAATMVLARYNPRFRPCLAPPSEDQSMSNPPLRPARLCARRPGRSRAAGRLWRLGQGR